MTEVAEQRRDPSIRPADPRETPALIKLADLTGVFQTGEAEALLGGVLDGLHAGRLGEAHQALVYIEGPSGPPLGWVYFAPTEKADGVWDLWWIGVDPTQQGQGIGGRLLQSVEDRVAEAGGRLLIIETSSLPRFDKVRKFYARRGYHACGVVPDFYAVGDGKAIYAKRLDGEV